MQNPTHSADHKAPRIERGVYCFLDAHTLCSSACAAFSSPGSGSYQEPCVLLRAAKKIAHPGADYQVPATIGGLSK